MADFPIDSKSLQAAIDKMRVETSDRSCAILGLATLEALLERLLRRGLAAEAPEELFARNGSLATLSSKIDLAFSIGLISQIERYDLHILRKIRNEFAHDFSHDLSFLSPAIESRIRTLSLPGLLENRAEFSGGDLRYRFYLGVVMLSSILGDYRMRKASACSIPADVRAA